MRSLRLLAASILALTAFASWPAQAAAPGDATVTVNLVDENGDPMPGSMYTSTASGISGVQQATSSATFTVAPGPFGIIALTPWGGILCAGFDPCDYLGTAMGSGTPTGDLVLTAGQNPSITITAEPPATLEGRGTVGSPMRVEFSDGIEQLLQLSGLGGPSLAPSATWLRDGEPIAGAEDDTYVPVAADVRKQLSVRLEYTGFAQSQFQALTGAPVEPRTTKSVSISKVRTKAFANLANPTIRAGRQGKVRVDVTAPDMFVTGQVKVVVGSWSKTATLRNGSARLVLPVLAPGKHTVAATFLGSFAFAPSKAAPKTLIVEKG